ncbi:MAG: PsbP-related protein [Candidatus Helarchaeota archaeon]
MNWNEYINTGIKLRYPSNWYVQDKELGVKEMIVMFSEYPLDDTCDGESPELVRNINLAAEIVALDNEIYSEFKEKPVKILEQYVNDKLKKLKDNIKEFKLIKRQNNIINGYLAINLVYTGIFLDKIVKWDQYFIVVDRDLISTITATALETHFDTKFQELVGEMVNSAELSA